MEKKFGKLISNMGKGTKEALEKSKNIVVQVMDKNEDGKIDLNDVSEMVSSVEGIVKKGAISLKETVDETTRQMELKVLKPIILEDMRDISIPRFIRIVERNKKYTDKEVCKEAIGFWTDFKEMRLMNIFKDSIDVYQLSFYPNEDSEFYYVNPIDKNHYISLDEYFSYLKQVRIGELQRIAQDLGAKYFKVLYKEEQIVFSEKKCKGKVAIKPISEMEVEREAEEKKYSKVEIASEMYCLGHEPIQPQVEYMKYEPAIENLIALRMNTLGPISHQKLTLKLSNSSGLKENEAVKIDAVLKGLKCSGNTTVSNEYKNESRRYLEYEIEF